MDKNELSQSFVGSTIIKVLIVASSKGRSWTTDGYYQIQRTLISQEVSNLLLAGSDNPE